MKPVNLGAALKFFLLVFLGGDRVGDLLGDALVPVLVLQVDMMIAYFVQSSERFENYLQQFWGLLVVHDEVSDLFRPWLYNLQSLVISLSPEDGGRSVCSARSHRRPLQTG